MNDTNESVLLCEIKHKQRSLIPKQNNSYEAGTVNQKHPSVLSDSQTNDSHESGILKGFNTYKPV